MKRFSVAMATLALASCNGGKGDDGGNNMPTQGGITVGADDGGSGDDGSADGMDDQGDGGDADADADADGDADAGDDAMPPPETKWDTGAGGQTFCKYKDAGIYCDGQVAITCGDLGDVISDVACVPDQCLAGTGCVPCLEGQYDCQGPNVVACDTSGATPTWQQLEVCDGASNQVCDIAMGTCVPTHVVGTAEPTGVYYEFAAFPSGQVYMSGYDVDGLDNRLYVSSSNEIDVYEVELLDSDGDGVLEPNQHPDNPDEQGEIEERVLTYIESLPVSVTLLGSTSELYIMEDRIYATTNQIDEYLLPAMTYSVHITPPPWVYSFAQMGYDDVHEVFYASNESNRRVYSYDYNTASWGIMFDYPPLAGDHMDGMEVVTDPTTGIPYVYVSDMTSDFIGQYRKDPDLGWVQENLFSYEGTSGTALEGLGFGPLAHFWYTSGNILGELGGGDVTDFLPPTG